MYDPSWNECLINSSKNSTDKMLNSISYNPNKSTQAKFFEDLALNLENTMSIASSITIMGDLNLNYLNHVKNKILIQLLYLMHSSLPVLTKQRDYVNLQAPIWTKYFVKRLPKKEFLCLLIN